MSEVKGRAAGVGAGVPPAREEARRIAGECDCAKSTEVKCGSCKLADRIAAALQSAESAAIERTIKRVRQAVADLGDSEDLIGCDGNSMLEAALARIGQVMEDATLAPTPPAALAEKARAYIAHEPACGSAKRECSFWEDFEDACSPETVLALVAVADAAKKVLAEFYPQHMDSVSGTRVGSALDAALAALAGLAGKESHVRKSIIAYHAEPWWRRAWWSTKAWLWPFRYCKHSRSIVVELPVACVWDSMLGSRRISFGYSYHRRVPVAMRVMLGALIEWRAIWRRDDRGGRS